MGYRNAIFCSFPHVCIIIPSLFQVITNPVSFTSLNILTAEGFSAKIHNNSSEAKQHMCLFFEQQQ